MELWDGDYIDDNDEDTEQNQEESDGEQNEEPQEEIGDVEDAMPIEETPTTSTVTQNEDVIHLDVIGEAIKAAKVGSSNTLLPHLLKLEGVYLNSPRKLLKSTKSDGITKEALTATVVSRSADDDELVIVDPPPPPPPEQPAPAPQDDDDEEMDNLILRELEEEDIEKEMERANREMEEEGDNIFEKIVEGDI